MDNLVSIIIPAYNCEKFIDECVSSIINQTYTNIEILIADDGSKDGTRKIIDSFTDPRIKTYHNTENQGVVFTRNNLLSKATGEFITFQDADDWSSKNRICEQVKAFEQDDNLFACFTQYIKTDANGREIFHSRYPRGWKEIKLQIPNAFLFACATIMIKKEVYRQLGGYHSYFNRTNDEDLYWISLIVMSYKSVNLEQAHYYYRFNEISLTKEHFHSSIKKLYIHHITKHLLIQYRETGTNDLINMDFENLQKLEKEYSAPFKSDKSYSFYLAGEKHLYWNNHMTSLKYALKAIYYNPIKLRNYKLAASAFFKSFRQ